MWLVVFGSHFRSVDGCPGGVMCSRGSSQVVYPSLDRSITETVSTTPLYKTLQSYLASMKHDLKRFVL